jgi:hypothetical protein
VGCLHSVYTESGRGTKPISDRDKHKVISIACGRGETGRRKGLKIPRPQGCAGSTPAVRTTTNDYELLFNSLRYIKGLLSAPRYKGATNGLHTDDDPKPRKEWLLISTES